MPRPVSEAELKDLLLAQHASEPSDFERAMADAEQLQWSTLVPPTGWVPGFDELYYVWDEASVAQLLLPINSCASPEIINLLLIKAPYSLVLPKVET